MDQIYNYVTICVNKMLIIMCKVCVMKSNIKNNVRIIVHNNMIKIRMMLLC